MTKYEKIQKIEETIEYIYESYLTNAKRKGVFAETLENATTALVNLENLKERLEKKEVE